MITRRKVVLVAAGVVGSALVLTAPLWIWFASNAAAGVLSLVLNRKPCESEVTGSYMYKAEWGEAHLDLDSDHKFEERVANKDGSSK